MPVTVRGTDILFNDGTTQSTAAAVSTAFDGVGSYAILMMAANTNLATGGTIAGSSLRYDSSQSQDLKNTGTPFYALYRNAAGNSTYTFGGSAVSGTWRKMSPGSTYFVDGYGIVWRGFALYVRIS